MKGQQMIWIILDGTGYPIRVFRNEDSAKETLAKYHPEMRLIRMLMEG